MLNSISRLLAFLFVALALITASCDRAASPGQNVLTGSKLTPVNYNQITTGMTKAQVERIMGPPTTMETKDMVIFKRTTYRYEEGAKFALFTFKNDELDSKEGNLTVQP
jgi:SmpA / OmlA family